MITKQLSFKADSILSDTIDTTSNITNISAGEATNIDTHFSYARSADSFLVHEDVIDYETQLALREKWKNLTITDNFLFEKVMHGKRVYFLFSPLRGKKAMSIYQKSVIRKT